MSEEKKIGFVPKIEKAKWGFGKEFYNMLITDKRLIFGKITGKGRKAAEAFLPFGYAVSRVRLDESKYADIGPEEILKADKKNFAIPFEDIDRLEIGKRRMIYRPVTIHLRSGEKKKFYHYDEKTLKELCTILRQLIGNKLVSPV